MPDSGSTNSKIVAAYQERTRKSAGYIERAKQSFPSGIVHDSRKLDPYPIYVTHGKGSRKWDVDGNEYVDYVGGHGALLLGHGNPAVVEAVARQVEKGTHYGACHDLEILWAEAIKRLIPCAERVRFTSSGTEANLMALRLARAFTGKSKIVRFVGHFHGWHDHAAHGVTNHFDGTPTPGVLAGVTEHILLAPPDDIAKTRKIIEGDDDIAAIFLEPTGASGGQSPVRKEFVAELQRLAKARKALLIFDEVVTGFRVSKGGAQVRYGITPDLATFAKIVAGGLPGGVVAGRQDILELLDFEVTKKKGIEKIGHQGTYNANPLSAAAGIAALDLIATTDACERAIKQAEKLRKQMNQVLIDENIPWAVYGDCSNFYILTGSKNGPVDPRSFDVSRYDDVTLRASGSHPAVNKLRLGLMVNGVDISAKPGGILSCTHSDEDIDRTADGLRKSVRLLKEEGELRA